MVKGVSEGQNLVASLPMSNSRLTCFRLLKQALITASMTTLEIRRGKRNANEKTPCSLLHAIKALASG